MNAPNQYVEITDQRIIARPVRYLGDEVRRAQIAAAHNYVEMPCYVCGSFNVRFWVEHHPICLDCWTTYEES